MDRARPLSLLDCVGLGINCIVGSGVYLLLAPMAKAAGPASIVAIFGCAMLCVLVALCFAELSGMYDQNGGTLLYAREAFGPAPAFAIGWMALVSSVLGLSAVAVGFGEAASRVWPGLSAVLLGPVTGKSAASVVLIVVLGAINHRGVKAGARTSDALSAAKLLPLVAVAVVGALFIDRSVVGRMFTAPPGTGYVSAVSAAAFTAMFMLSGFEYVPVPAGEAQQARSAVPRAILGSLLGATLLYCVLQLVASSVLPDLPSRAHPLIDVAGVLFGSTGAGIMLAASLVSMAGFCAASAMVSPRYVASMAEHGMLPPLLARRTRAGTPGAAIIAITVVASSLALVQGYAALVDVANVAVFAQYLPACVAVVVLRVKRPDLPRRFRLPLGPLIPGLAALVSVGLLAAAQPTRDEWLAAGGFLLLGLAAWGVTRLTPSRPAA